MAWRIRNIGKNYLRNNVILWFHKQAPKANKNLSDEVRFFFKTNFTAFLGVSISLSRPENMPKLDKSEES